MGGFSRPGRQGRANPPHALWRVHASGGVEKLLDLACRRSLRSRAGSRRAGRRTSRSPTGARSPVPAPFHVAPRPLPRRGRGGEGDRRLDRLRAPTGASAPLGALRDPDVRLRGGVAPPPRPGKADGPGPPHARRRVSSRSGATRRPPRWRRSTPASSGRRLLVQVHRPRPQMDQRLFKDPALAVWEEGQPAPARVRRALPERADEQGVRPPRRRDGRRRGAVRLRLGRHRPRASSAAAGRPATAARAGRDVVQEWGVVKASLRQRLVIPAVARTAGAGGAFWKTDLLLGNPGRRAAPASTSGSFRRGGGEAREAIVSLASREIRLVPDVLGGSLRRSRRARARSSSRRRGPASSRRRAGPGPPRGRAPSGCRWVRSTSSRRRAPGSRSASRARFPGAGYRTNVGGRRRRRARRDGRPPVRVGVGLGRPARPHLRGGRRAERRSSTGSPRGSASSPGGPAPSSTRPRGARSSPSSRRSTRRRTTRRTGARPSRVGRRGRSRPSSTRTEGTAPGSGATSSSTTTPTRSTSVTLAAKPWDSTARRDDRDADAPPARGEGRPRRARRRLPAGGRGAAPVRLERERGRDRRPRHVAHLHGAAGRRHLRRPAPAAQRVPDGRGRGGDRALRRPRRAGLPDEPRARRHDRLRRRQDRAGPRRGDRRRRRRRSTPSTSTCRSPAESRSTTSSAPGASATGPPRPCVRVSPAGGLVGAYATSIDQGTNDAILVSAALAARD